MLYGMLLMYLIYSFLLTVVILYKDKSSYYNIEDLDIFMAGIVMWVLLLILLLIRLFLKLTGKKYMPSRKPKPYKEKNQKYIAKVVKKIIKNYRKRCNSFKNKQKSVFLPEYFDFTRMREYDYNYNICGWMDLIVKKPINERINNQFYKLMSHQKDETIKEIIKYFNPINLDNEDLDEYFVERVKRIGKPIYEIKE